MSVAGCYDLALSCDYGFECERRKTRHNFLGTETISYNYEKGSTCRAAARRDGWRFDEHTGKAVCGQCRKAGRTLEDAPG